MAISLLQTASNQSGAAGLSSGTVTFGSSVTSGSLIAVFVDHGTSATVVTSISDGLGNTYQAAVENGGANGAIGIWYASNISGGAAPTLTVNFVQTANRYGIIAREYAGLSVSPLDKVQSNLGATSTSQTSNATATLSQSGELVVGACSYLNNGTSAVGSGFGNFVDDVITGQGDLAAEDQIVSSTAGIAATFSSTTGESYAAAVATFIPNAGPVNFARAATMMVIR